MRRALGAAIGLSIQLTRLRSVSVLKPNPYIVLARWSDHCPNFGEVLVKLILAVTVLFTSA